MYSVYKCCPFHGFKTKNFSEEKFENVIYKRQYFRVYFLHNII